jgi:hypothetical protein
VVHSNHLADAIGTICRRFPDAYAGHVLDRDRGIVTVYVTRKGSGELVRALSAEMGPVEAGGYELVRAAHTFAALKGLTARIARDRMQLEAAGLRLIQWGPNVASNAVKVKLSGYTEEAAGYLVERYGADWITVAPWEGRLPRRV